MALYQVAIIAPPDDWEPQSPDDVPAELSGPSQVVSESEDLFVAVREVIEHNEKPKDRRGGQWAVVIEPGSPGRTLPAGRLCTPLGYKVTTIWWPDGWEPDSPLDVPNCVWRFHCELRRQRSTYQHALATVKGLNRQCMDRPGTTWHVIVGVESEAVSQTVANDTSGTETTIEVHRLHVIRPEQGGRGDCSHCPAHSFQCAKEEWSSQAQTIASRQSRPRA